MDHGAGGTPQGERPEAEYPGIMLGNGYKPGLKPAAVLGAAVAGVLVWGLKKRFGMRAKPLHERGEKTFTLVGDVALEEDGEPRVRPHAVVDKAFGPASGRRFP